MPIVINGSGTVTGISVGGLPDGIVDTDMIASSVSMGITEADQWRITANVTGDAAPISSNWERNDTTGFNKLGTGLTESSGIFSFPSTGIWQITATSKSYHNAANKWQEFMIYTTSDNGSNWIKSTEPSGSIANFGANAYSDAHSTTIFDVTNTTNCKCRFHINQNDGSAVMVGNSDFNTSYVTFIRLGDT